jgi:DNA mismatch endonuclease (patch repair protein)
MDVLTAEQRSRCMSAIRGKDTRPERAVRSLVHRLGFRYSLHRRDLPGCPDMVFPRLRKIIFVHGCFWHCHRCRYGAVRPKANASFWRAKREGNRDRDRKNLRKLRRQGWCVLNVWECWLRNPERLASRVAIFLRST